MKTEKEIEKLLKKIQSYIDIIPNKIPTNDTNTIQILTALASAKAIIELILEKEGEH